jgi:hypothetical protein
MRTNVLGLDGSYLIMDLFKGRELATSWIKIEPVYGDFKIKVEYERIDKEIKAMEKREICIG